MSDLSDACKVPCEPSKILTRHRVPFRADFGWIFGILPSLVVNCEVSVSADIGCIHRFSRQKTKKCGEKFTKCRVLGPKTSDFLDTNLRTFVAKPPYFVAKKSDVSDFPVVKGAKFPCSRFCDISGRGKAWWLPRPFSAR